MKNLILIFSFILLFLQSGFSQVSIATDDFDTPGNWTINTVVGAPINSVVPGANETEMMGTATEDNRWMINSVYSNADYSCLGFTVGAATVPAQPAGIPNQNTNYLHTIAHCSILAGELDASWNASLEYKRRFFAYMDYDFVTTNYYSVNFSYWSTHAAGISVYYSINGGTDWILLEDSPNNGAWMKSNISDIALDNQATLRFGYLWDDASGGNSNFPSIDALELSVPALTCNFYEDKTTVCVDDTVYFTNLSTPEDASVTYSWSVNPGSAGVDWNFVDATTSTSKDPHIEFLTTNTYNVQLITSRSSTSESLNQTDVIEVISGCQCTSGGGTVELINEDPILANWTNTGSSGSGTWKASPSVYFNPSNPAGNEAYLITQETPAPLPLINNTYADLTWPSDVDFSDASATYELSFSYSSQRETGPYQNILEVYVSTNSGGTWNLVQTYNSDTGPTNWVSETVDLSSYGGNSNVRISFRGIRDYYWINFFGMWLMGASAWDTGLNDILLTKTTTGGGTGDEPTATITLTSGTNPACSGENLEFTCTATNLGVATVDDYEWFVDGTSVQTGASDTYTTNTLTDGQAVTCAISLTGGTCDGPFESDVYMIAIDEVLTPHVWIDADPATYFCQGTNVLFTAMPTNEGTAPTYQWQLNGSNVGTATTYSSGTLSDGDLIDLTMTSNVTCPSTNPVTDSYIVSVNDTTVAEIGHDTPAACEGIPTEFSVTNTTGNPAFTYEWFVNGVASGTGSTYTNGSLNYGDEVYLVQSSTTTCPGTSNIITIMGLDPANSLDGAYTIQALSLTYPTLTAAIDSLMQYGVKGNVEFNIIDLTYNEQLVIPNICGVDAANTVTFQSWCDDCGMPIIEYDADASDNYTLRLNKSKYITFKKIDFRALGSANGHVIEIDNEANNIIFEDCIFTGVSTADNSTDFALINSENQNISSISFIDNEFNDGSFGLNITEDFTQTISDLSISGNTFNNQSYNGIYLSSVDAPSVLKNIISTSSTRDDYSGINMFYIINDLSILGNKISTTTADGFGMNLIDLQGTAGSTGLIANNMVQIGDNAISQGIYLGTNSYTTEYQNIYFNSINSTSSASGSSALKIENSNGNIELRNNALNGNSEYAIYINPGTSISSSDYNDLYSTGTLGYWDGSNRNNLPQWRTGSGQDANSISTNPNFLSVTNLHTENASLAAGTFIAGITTDYDDETRQATPYIGADEYLGTVVWTGNTSTDWEIVTNWTPNTHISQNTNIQIPTAPTGGNFPETNSNSNNLAECKNITIDLGAHLYIAPNKYLTVWGDFNQNGTFIIQSDAAGTGSFINKGAINYGGSPTTTVQRYISGLNWHYVSSPITNAQSTLFHPNNFYLYNETTDDSWSMNTFTGGFTGWEDASAIGALTVMRGYATYENTGIVNFTGTLNTGNQSYNPDYTINAGATFDGWNLVGNPYPSSLNWNDADNITRTNVDAAIYFYDDNGTGNYDKYTYFIPQVNTSPYPGVAVNRVSGCVPVSQGFFIKANAPGASLQYTDAARIHNSTDFYKGDNKDLPPTIRLSVENNGNIDETVMRFIPEATINYDGEYDAFKLVGYADIPNIYSFTKEDSINLSINSLPDLDKYTLVPLGFKTDHKDNYSLKATELILPEGIITYLIDDYIKSKIELKKDIPYTFYSEEGNFRNRFQIVFSKEETNSVDETDSNIQIFSYNKILYVNLPDYPKDKTLLTVSDISGKQLINKYLLSNRNYIDMNHYASGIYFVKLISGEHIYLKKVILTD